MRNFETGATRNDGDHKLRYEGFLSPHALHRYAQYMHSHRLQADGKMRDPDNWQKGIPKDVYMDCLVRHVFDAWRLHRGGVVYDPDKLDEPPVKMEELLCAITFNAMGYLHEEVKPEQGSEFAYIGYDGPKPEPPPEPEQEKPRLPLAIGLRTPKHVVARLKTDGYWYVASPYTKYKDGHEVAFQRAARAAAWLIERGVNVYCPIAHTHPLAQYSNIDACDLDTWMRIDQPFIDGADGLIILEMAGWARSKGVTMEIEAFDKAKKPVVYFACGK